MKATFSFRVTHRHPSLAARCATLTTPHGDAQTPAFMPVGTTGAVKAMTAEMVATTGARIVLGNTFHLHVRPGESVVEKLGGLHKFSGWQGPMLTDSGGFQVFSLAKLRTITEAGVEFRSPINGDLKFLSPETSMAIQRTLGADIAMAFDEVPALPAPRETVAAAAERTARWAERCLAAPRREGQALFGIVQGGTDAELRRISAAQITSLGFDGFAIGGLSVGESTAELHATSRLAAGLLPDDRPRYLMGVGKPEDIVAAVEAGVDLFDCIIPTRSARHGSFYTSAGRLSIKRTEFTDDVRPLDERCTCYTCRTHSRGYLRHLFMCGELTFYTLATLHNLHYFGDLMRRLREAIAAGTSLRAELAEDATVVD